ncbi:adenosine kinase [Kibdelosporangium banguiense]|uniref:Adenosine kinase n=1 Tax=Kibdelosporangium banguiense TaxID=1365924 RepID=A0ABS4TSC7_9PSEU|nr:carbohydrate kinase family protein [Kibdelosporangium banguiense]MBP2327317.1 adenosine kinase [Kibdelosporangium banguiense]
MSITVTGSIATDHLMVFPGSFREQLVDDRLDRISLSFLVDDLQVRRGGVAANIAFGLGCLGMAPILVGAVGPDFAEYQLWLKHHGVDTDSVHVSSSRHTARFVCTTDAHDNQIASFYPGAMTESKQIDLGPIVGRAGPDIVLICPDDPDAMLLHTRQCRDLQVPFAADPSQQLARLGGDAIRSLVDGAEYLFTNDYEAGLLQAKTGWNTAEILSRVGAWLVTLGPDGVDVLRSDHSNVRVAAPKEQRRADPTGVGDAFRAGFLAGRSWGLSDERAAQLGCTLATLVIEVVGTQEYWQGSDVLAVRIAEAYGPEAAADITPLLNDWE